MHFHPQLLGGVVWCGHTFVGRETAVEPIIIRPYVTYGEKQTVPNLLGISGRP